ncbi:hypothetical protein ACNJUI_21290, partial [Mycobacterium tuberculosis]
GEDLRRTTLESSPVDQLIGEGRAADDRPLDIDPEALDRDRDTGDFESTTFDQGGDLASGGGSGEGPDIAERAGAGATLAEHLHAQVGPAATDEATA